MPEPRPPSTEHERFEESFRRTYPDVAAYCLRRCATRQDAEDAATEVFATAWRRRRDVPPPPEDRLWLFGVARRVVANQRRGETRRVRLLERLAAARPCGDVVDQGRLAAALNDLTPADRELLLLSAWEGLKPAEIAAVVGTDPGVVSRRLYKARRRLASALDPLPA